MGQVVGGEADAGSADNNAVIIKGGIINGAASGSGPKGMSVIGPAAVARIQITV